MGVVPLFIVMIFSTISFIWYWIYGRKTVARESALIRFIKRIASRALPYEDMGAELKEILKQRDEIVEDRFDRLVGKCLILDIPEKTTAEECFEKMSYPLSDILKLEPNIIEGMLMARERESSTALTPGLAIPHIVIEGSGIFELVLVRGREGVLFPDNPQPVHALFALFGSPDERNFHLRALMAIAQIAQGRNFMQRWMDAKGAEELRDVILLGKRRRHE
jgi:mannitol/fructose-specific phosphotransferase system IIA component (Ntr-type)